MVSSDSLACAHKAFVHRVLPRIIHQARHEILSLLNDDETTRDFLTRAVEITEEVYPLEKDDAALYVDDFVVSRVSRDGHRYVSIELTKPTEAIAAYYICLVTKEGDGKNGPEIRYFTLELQARDEPDEEEQTMVCEWSGITDGNFVHLAHEVGPKPSLGAFLDRISPILERCFCQTGTS